MYQDYVLFQLDELKCKWKHKIGVEERAQSKVID